MKGLKLLTLLLVIYFTFCAFDVFKDNGTQMDFVPISHEYFFTLKHGEHYYKVDENGYVYSFDTENDRTIITCVNLVGNRIDRKELNNLKGVRNIINSEIVSEICVNKKILIAIKGVVVYFYRWEDLKKYFPEFERKFAYIPPRTVYKLFGGGLVVLEKRGN